MDRENSQEIWIGTNNKTKRAASKDKKVACPLFLLFLLSAANVCYAGETPALQIKPYKILVNFRLTKIARI